MDRCKECGKKILPAAGAQIISGLGIALTIFSVLARSGWVIIGLALFGIGRQSTALVGTHDLCRACRRKIQPKHTSATMFQAVTGRIVIYGVLTFIGVGYIGSTASDKMKQASQPYSGSQYYKAPTSLDVFAATIMGTQPEPPSVKQHDSAPNDTELAILADVGIKIVNCQIGEDDVQRFRATVLAYCERDPLASPIALADEWLAI